jgi:hypothetical protein
MTQEQLIETPETTEAPAPEVSVRDRYIAEAKAEQGVAEPPPAQPEPETETPTETEESKPEGEAPPAEEPEETPEDVPAPLSDEEAARYPGLNEHISSLPPEMKTQMAEWKADVEANVHNFHGAIDERMAATADTIIGNVHQQIQVVNSLHPTVNKLVGALQAHARNQVAAAELAPLINNDAKEAFTAILGALNQFQPQALAAAADAISIEERPKWQAQGGQYVVGKFFDAGKQLNVPSLTKKLKDLDALQGDARDKLFEETVRAIFDTGYNEGSRGSKAAYGRQASVDGNKGVGPAALAGSAAGGNGTELTLENVQTKSIDELKAIRERQRRAS